MFWGLYFACNIRSPACFELSWPMRKESPFLRVPTKRKRVGHCMNLSIMLSVFLCTIFNFLSNLQTGKSTFVEHRTFLHLYRSFHRMWIFLIVMFQVHLTFTSFHAYVSCFWLVIVFIIFQGLTIVAFKDGKLNLDTFKTLLSIGPTYAILKFLECE